MDGLLVDLRDKCFDYCIIWFYLLWTAPLYCVLFIILFPYYII